MQVQNFTLQKLQADLCSLCFSLRRHKRIHRVFRCDSAQSVTPLQFSHLFNEVFRDLVSPRLAILVPSVAAVRLDKRAVRRHKSQGSSGGKLSFSPEAFIVLPGEIGSPPPISLSLLASGNSASEVLPFVEALPYLTLCLYRLVFESVRFPSAESRRVGIRVGRQMCMAW